MVFKPTMSVLDLQKGAQEIVDNGLILEPKMAAPTLAARLAEETPEPLRTELGTSLIVKHYTHLILAGRLKRRTLERPKGYEHLPLRIEIQPKDGKRRFVRVDNANLTQMVYYCKIRESRHKHRKKADLVLKAARKLRETLRRRSKKARGITAGEILHFDFGAPNEKSVV